MNPHPVRPMLERAAYLAHLLLLIASICALWLGSVAACHTGDFRPPLFALAGLALAIGVHRFGNAHWHFRECDQSLSFGGNSETALFADPKTQQAAEFALLLSAFASAPDVWTRGEARRALTQRLAADPGLRDEFAEELAEHPDL